MGLFRSYTPLFVSLVTANKCPCVQNVGKDYKENGKNPSCQFLSIQMSIKGQERLNQHESVVLQQSWFYSAGGRSSASSKSTTLIMQDKCMERDPATSASVILVLQSRNRKATIAWQRKVVLSLCSFCRHGGMDGTRIMEKMEKERWGGEESSQRRGNGDRSIRAKTTGLLSGEYSRGQRTVFHPGCQEEWGREEGKRHLETGEKQKANIISYHG